MFAITALLPSAGLATVYYALDVRRLSSPEHTRTSPSRAGYGKHRVVGGGSRPTSLSDAFRSFKSNRGKFVNATIRNPTNLQRGAVLERRRENPKKSGLCPNITLLTNNPRLEPTNARLKRHAPGSPQTATAEAPGLPAVANRANSAADALPSRTRPRTPAHLAEATAFLTEPPGAGCGLRAAGCEHRPRRSAPFRPASKRAWERSVLPGAAPAPSAKVRA